MKKNFIYIGIILIFVVLIIGIILIFTNAEKVNDAQLFKTEYKKVASDNVFEYKTSKEIIDILSKGTGVVYLGFPECKWCQAYVPMLDRAAKDNGIDRIYYFNIKEEREKNSRDYERIVKLTSKFLTNDEEGHKRVYVPDVYVVVNGNIISHNNETSIVKEDISPKEYWSLKKQEELKKNLDKMFAPLESKSCTSCN